MADYHFVTEWRVAASIEPVWDAIYDNLRWPQWWKSVANVVQIEVGDSVGLGAVYRYSWRTHLPYTLEFDSRVTRIEKPHIIEGHAFGELEGTGLWELSNSGDETIVRYTWDVRTTKAWMNLLAPIAKPLFKWNHDAVMKDGCTGLAQLLRVSVVDMPDD